MHPALRAVPATRHRIAATLGVLLALLATAVATSATPAALGRPPHTAVAVAVAVALVGPEAEAETAEVGAGSADRTHAGPRTDPGPGTHTGPRTDAPDAGNCPARATARFAHLGERPSAPEHHATVPHTTRASRAAGSRAPESARTPAPPGPPLHDRNRAPPVPSGT
ncbi:hypothetical protein [Streptomyces erythrochromogenes]|uniref:hypothetical protein n=1 Tax=Streptomyces erythrochromogenes TaxID=285574 RepID=UPI0037D3FFFD